MDTSSHSNLSSSPSSVLTPLSDAISSEKLQFFTTPAVDRDSSSSIAVIRRNSLSSSFHNLESYLSNDTNDSSEEQQEEEVILTLEEFEKQIPNTIRASSSQNVEERGGANCQVGSLFRNLRLKPNEIQKHAFVDPHKNYTRNLISTDNETYTLLLLCWNAGKDKFSPIHDHPCDGCWMRVCQGCVREVRYEMDEDMDCLCRTEDIIMNEGEDTYINDYMGYHKIGNPSEKTMSISLHLYSPPFQSCKIWMNPDSASSSYTSKMCNFSEYGEQI